MEENINQISEATHNQEDTNNEPDSENSIDDESGSEEDESYCEELEEDESDNESIESSSSTVSYGEVPDAFANYIAGPNAVEIEEKEAEKLFDKSQEYLRAWDANPDDESLRDMYFKCVHDLILNPSFSRMQKNPYTLNWNSARRMEERLSSGSFVKIFYGTHLQLTKLAHNSIPHYLQMLAITPSRIDLWYELGAKAVQLGDWKNAEFAYRKYMAFGGDKTKALQNVVLLHFVSGDFLEATVVLKDLLTHQPNNAVGRVIATEMMHIKGPWAEYVDSILTKSGPSKSHIELTQDKIDWVLSKIESFRSNLKTKCRECINEAEFMAETVNHLQLEEKDILFYHFGNHLLKFMDAFLKEPNGIIFITLPMRICGSEKDQTPDILQDVSTDDLESTCQVADIESEPIDQSIAMETHENEVESVCQAQCIKNESTDQPIPIETNDDLESVCQVQSIKDENMLDLTEAANIESEPIDEPIVIETHENEMESVSQIQSIKQESTDVINLHEPTDQPIQMETHDDLESLCQIQSIKNEPTDQPIPIETNENEVERTDQPIPIETNDDLESACQAQNIKHESRESTIPIEAHNEVERPDNMAGKTSEKSKPPRFIKSSINTFHLQIMDFLNDIASDKQFTPEHQIRGLCGMTSVLDNLLCFVIKNRPVEDFKKHELDRRMFRKLYCQWCKLTEKDPKFKPKNVESIHLYAYKLGFNDVMKKLDELVLQLKKHPKGNIDFEDSFPPNTTLNDNVDFPNPPDSPAFSHMIETYKRLKSHQSKIENSENVLYDIESELPEKTPKLLSLYLTKFELSSNFDIRPPAYVEKAQLDRSSDLFSTTNLTTLTNEQCHFLIFYHLEKARLYSSAKSARDIEYRHLSTALKIINHYLLLDDIETIQTHEDFENNVEISASLSQIPLSFNEIESSVKRVIELCKDFKRQYLDSLIVQFEGGESSEIEELVGLIKSYNLLDGDPQVKLDKLFTLYRCYKLRSNSKEMLNVMLWLLDFLVKNSEIRKDFLIAKLEDCLTEIDYNLTVFTELALEELASALGELTEKSFYRMKIRLWITYYRVYRFADPSNKEEFRELFAEVDNIDHRLPTKSLMILKKAHGVLSGEKCCMKDGGEFLRFYLDELISITNSSTVQDALNDSDIFVSDIFRKVDREILQLLNCLYNLELSGRVAKKHEHVEPTPTFLQLDWSVCERILPLFLPDDLPTLAEKNTISVELNELLNKLQGIIEMPITEELKTAFDKFVDINKRFRPKCTFNPSTEEFSISWAQGNANLLNWPRTSDLSLNRRKLSAKSLYLMAFREFKASLLNEDEKSATIIRMAKNALLFGNDTLGADSLATLWTIIAIKTNYILKKPDLELFTMINDLFFPYHMAIALHPNMGETQLDAATVYYRLVTRFKRYLANSQNTQFRNEIESTIVEYLSKASVHFQMAHAHRNDNFELGWSAKYFLGKIAEKLNAPLIDVIQNYQQCAFLMEENFQFMKKISKIDQNDFEPLELYYCIHSFLNKRRDQAFKNGDFCELRKVVRCLELFAEQHISRTDDKTHNFSIDLRSELNEVGQKANEELLEGTSNLIGSPMGMRKINLMKKYNNEAEELCCHAFEKILSLFPHYKSAYRLAKYMADYGNFKDSADYLFKEIFPSKGDINENSYIFKQFVDIHNTSFYYHEVLNHHMFKLIDLLLLCLVETNDIRRFIYVLNSLLKLYNQRVRKLNLSKDVIEKLIKNAINHNFGKLIQILYVNKEYTAATDPLYQSRSILFEIDKQLKGSGFDFAEGFHHTVNLFKEIRWNTFGRTESLMQ